MKKKKKNVVRDAECFKGEHRNKNVVRLAGNIIYAYLNLPVFFPPISHNEISIVQL